MQDEEHKAELTKLKESLPEKATVNEDSKLQVDKKEEEKNDDINNDSNKRDSIQDAQNEINEFDNQQKIRNQVYKNMETLLKNVLQDTKIDQWIQVMESELPRLDRYGNKSQTFSNSELHNDESNQNLSKINEQINSIDIDQKGNDANILSKNFASTNSKFIFN